MSESTQDNKDNIKTNHQVTADETLIQDNLDAEADLESSSSDSSLLQDEIQMTLKEFNQKIKDNDRSIKRIEESMAALYDKLDRTPEVVEGSGTSSKKKLKKKKLDKKGKKEKKLDKKGKKQGKKMKGRKNANSAKATTSPEKKKTRRTISKNNKGRIKNATKKK
ncbi:MAG: hypothetical protein WBX81_14690 [Nitrososphaeraceae archaeon]